MGLQLVVAVEAACGAWCVSKPRKLEFLLMLVLCTDGMGVLCEGTPDTNKWPWYSQCIVNQRTDCRLQSNVLTRYVAFTHTHTFV